MDRKDYFAKLPHRLVILVSTFLTGLNKKLINAKIEENRSSLYWLHSISAKSITNIVNTFKVCKSEYASILENLKIRHYLIKFADKYVDVRILAYSVGVWSPVK